MATGNAKGASEQMSVAVEIRRQAWEQALEGTRVAGKLLRNRTADQKAFAVSPDACSRGSLLARLVCCC